eukprot:466195-Amphidinium_carterae.1
MTPTCDDLAPDVEVVPGWSVENNNHPFDNPRKAQSVALTGVFNPDSMALSWPSVLPGSHLGTSARRSRKYSTRS